MAIKKISCNCYYTVDLFIIDLIILISLSLIGLGIFDIYYAKTTVFEQCFVDTIDKLFMSYGGIFISLGILIAIECIYTHIMYLNCMKSGSNNPMEKLLDANQYFTVYNNNVFVPINTIWFIIPIFYGFILLMFGVFGPDSECHNLSFNLLIINSFVVGFLPLTLLLLCILLITIPYMIYGIGLMIYTVVMFLYNNVSNICCFKITLNIFSSSMEHANINSKVDKPIIYSTCDNIGVSTSNC